MARNIDFTGQYDRVSAGAPPETSIILLTHDHGEMLRVDEDGFYVRGVKVLQDENEAQAVYECFKEWLTWSTLNRQ